MSDILKSMQSIMEELDQGTLNENSDPVAEEEIQKSLTFDLEKAEESEEISSYIDTSSFLSEIAATVDRNNFKVARAMEKLATFAKSQGDAIVALTGQLEGMRAVVEAIGSQPAPKKGILHKSEAQAILDGVDQRQFVRDESQTQGDSYVPLGAIKKSLSLALITASREKQGTADFERLSGDALRIEALDSGSNAADAINLLSPVGKQVASSHFASMQPKE